MLGHGRAPRPEDAAADRRHAVRLATSARTSWRSRAPSASSRRPAATRSSSSAAARRWTAPARSSAPGIPVMGHVGLTPQTADGARRLQGPGQDGQAARRSSLEEALALQSVGCFAIVFEAVPAAVTEAIVERLEVPTIGIGAGPATAGQVLVFHDLLGHQPRPPRQVRQALRERPRADGRRRLRAYADEVRSGALPGARPRLRDRAGRAGRLPALPGPGDHSPSASSWDWEPLP